MIETCYALFAAGVLECRQSFLYGPFCSIYGLGSVALILILKSKFSKNNRTLFWGGVLIGSITEYVVSWFGEIVLGIKWWDYSNKFLNINGRICLLFSLFWGILALYLIKVLNPKVDKFIDLMANTLPKNIVKAIVGLGFVFLLLDALVSSLAINYYTLRVIVENDLAVSNIEEVQESYNKIYCENPKLSEFIYKYWGNETMVMTYPNLTIELSDGTKVLIRNLYPELKYCYYNFKDSQDDKTGSMNINRLDIVLDKDVLL
ncbi:MAG: putative ABC transporter permease [Clostridia bacterium]|nr:putative ABC transporter permease [Clostridia bacterium]